jgi:hypothetical protein
MFVRGHYRRDAALVLTASLFVVLAASAAFADQPASVTSLEAKDHVGKTTTVCGKVVSLGKSLSKSGKFWFLHLDRPAPNQVFSVVVSGNKHDNVFWDPDKKYANQNICVTGYVRDTNGMIHIRADRPTQIKIVKSPDPS